MKKASVCTSAFAFLFIYFTTSGDIIQSKALNHLYRQVIKLHEVGQIRDSVSEKVLHKL